MEDKEEGELSDGNEEDSFGLSYRPVSRPDTSQYRRVERHVPSSDEDYSSDTDSDSPIAPKRKCHNVCKMDTGGSISHEAQGWRGEVGGPENRPIVKARRRNNVWSTVMEEQVLAQEIGGFGLKRRLDQGDRSVESYDYVRAQQILRGEDPNYSEDEDSNGEEEEDEETKNKRLNRKRHVKDRLSHGKPKSRSGKRELVSVEVLDSMTDEEVGLAIADGLMERKPQLIVRVVEVLGRDKALDLYKKTQDVEREGGMMVLNGSRRRTSGGVFLQLLKGITTLERSDLLKIFSPDESGSGSLQQQWRKRKRAHRRRERHESKPQGETANEEGLNLGELFSDDPGGAKCPGSTPVTSPQPSDTDDEQQQLNTSLINQLSPSVNQDLIPQPQPPPSPPPPTTTTITTTTTTTTTDHHKVHSPTLDTCNGTLVDTVTEPDTRREKENTKNKVTEVFYDDDFLDLHGGNDEMELF